MRRSNDRDALIATLSALIPKAQTETHGVDDAASARLGVNRTDLRCLGTVIEHGRLSASKLADSVGLTRGSMTIALDRLEKAQLIRRTDDPHDRRAVQVEATPVGKKAIREIWEPVRDAGMALLETYDDDELRILIRFFEAYVDLQRAQAERLRRPKRR